MARVNTNLMKSQLVNILWRRTHGVVSQFMNYEGATQPKMKRSYKREKTTEIYRGTTYYQNDDNKKQQETLWSLKENNIALIFLRLQTEKRKDNILVVNPIVSPSETKNWIRERLLTEISKDS